MPEGPEVYALAKALQALGFHCWSYGKHLRFENGEDWSFGLVGKVHLSDKNELTKSGNSTYTGTITTKQEQLGPDWMTATRREIQLAVEKMYGSPKPVGVLLTDQHILAGVGVAWGSEVCLRAGVKPNVPANRQNIRPLIDALVDTRNSIADVYSDYVHSHESRHVVNGWFKNLYGVRTMSVYKLGTPIKLSGRTWWV